MCSKAVWSEGDPRPVILQQTSRLFVSAECLPQRVFARMAFEGPDLGMLDTGVWLDIHDVHDRAAQT